MFMDFKETYSEVYLKSGCLLQDNPLGRRHISQMRQPRLHNIFLDFFFFFLLLFSSPFSLSLSLRV